MDAGINEIAAPEAAAELQKLNDFGRTDWSDEWFRLTPPVYVYSLYWHPIWRDDLGSLGRVLIPACAPGRPYSEAVRFSGFCASGGFGCRKNHVHEPAIPGMHRDEFRLQGGDGQMGWTPVPGEKIAEAIIGLGTGSPALSNATTNREWYGVFRAAGKVPTRAELAAASDKLGRLAALIVGDGDELAAQGPMGVRQIRPVHREMLDYLHEKRAWANMPAGKELCPQCQEPMQPGTRKHGCGYLVDPEWLFNEGQLDEATFKRVMASRAPKSGKQGRLAD